MQSYPQPQGPKMGILDTQIQHGTLTQGGKKLFIENEFSPQIVNFTGLIGRDNISQVKFDTIEELSKMGISVNDCQIKKVKFFTGKIGMLDRKHVLKGF